LAPRAPARLAIFGDPLRHILPHGQVKAHMKVTGAHVVFHRLLKVTPEGISPEDFVQAVLLCKRTLNAPIHAGYWGLISGKVKNETPIETVKREVREELKICQGLDLDATGGQLTELVEVTIARGEGTSVIKYYSCPLNYDLDRLTLLPNAHGKVEGEGLAWFSAAEVHHLMVRPEDRIAVSRYFGERGT
jgi:8-oxo-dGTP pyrophosphatase MutT (NUDIX family)